MKENEKKKKETLIDKLIKIGGKANLREKFSGHLL